jgi:hypothetical protein
MRGFRFSLDAMWAETARLNLLELVPALDMPVFFFLGRNDHWVPPPASVAYFEALSAPSKELVWLEQSGHEPFADEPAKFNSAMAGLVRRPSSAARRLAPQGGEMDVMRDPAASVRRPRGCAGRVLHTDARPRSVRMLAAPAPAMVLAWNRPICTSAPNSTRAKPNGSSRVDSASSTT